MIVVVIVSILAMIAYPSYRSHIIKARRADGQAALLDLASRMERFYSENNGYAGATVAAGNPVTDVLAVNQSPEGWYVMSISAQAPTSYSLQATPQNAQAAEDTWCANLMLNSLGQKGMSGPGPMTKCW